jgi:DNA-binding MarR family transcriptional regulator
MKDGETWLSPREISLLRCLGDGGLPRKEVAKITGMLQPELTRLVKSLESKGIISVHKKGISSSIAFSDSKHASLFRRVLNEYGHMRLEEVLSLASLRVIASLAARPASTREELLSSSGISPRTLHTVLRKFRGVGIVRVQGRGVYGLSDRFVPFGDFSREMMSFSNQRKVLAFSSDSVVIWERGSEFIVRTKARKESSDFKLTAFSAFEDYGVPLIQDWHYYYHPVRDWRRTVDEVLLQSMLVRPRDARENTAILMLWEKNGLSRRLGRIREGAARYGLEGEIETIVAYFQYPERNRPSGFPKMRDLREKMGGR